jgi:hypothetical protein
MTKEIPKSIATLAAEYSAKIWNDSRTWEGDKVRTYEKVLRSSYCVYVKINPTKEEMHVEVKYSPGS